METSGHHLTVHIFKVKRAIFSAPHSESLTSVSGASACQPFVHQVLPPAGQIYFYDASDFSRSHFHSLLLFSLFFFFLAYGILVPCAPAVEMQSLNHSAAREVPERLLKRVQELGSSLLEKTQDPA